MKKLVLLLACLTQASTGWAQFIDTDSLDRNTLTEDEHQPSLFLSALDINPALDLDESETVNNTNQANSNDNTQTSTNDLPPPSKWSLRLIRSRGTTSSLKGIITSDITWDDRNTRATGLEFGRLLTESFKGWPVDLVGIIGVYNHNEGNYQHDLYQLYGGIRADWKRFPWNKFVRTKLSFTEGLSWTNGLLYTEQVDSKFGAKPSSKLLNYLDINFRGNINDVLGQINHHWKNEFTEKVWLGIGISHRSGIFGLFNGVDGGSNYIYLSISYGHF